MRKSALATLLILVHASSIGSAATFRKHERALFRPTICATLLEEFVDQGADRSDVKGLLLSLDQRLEELYLGLPEGLRNEIKVDVKMQNLKFQYDVTQPNWHENLLRIGERVNSLTKDAQGVNPDQIVWIRAIQGKDAIQKNLEARRSKLIEAQAAVRAEFRTIMPEFRVANMVHLAAVGGLYAFLAVNAIDSFLNLDLRQLLQPALMYLMAYSQYHTAARTLQEMGYLPIESSQSISRFDLTYVDFIDRLLGRLEDFTMDQLLSYSDKIPITSEQFIAMKSCTKEGPNVGPDIIAGSCAVDKMLRADQLFPSKKLNVVLESERRAHQVDPRWSEPIIEFDEILMADPKTGEPVMISFMVIKAKVNLPVKKKEDKKVQEDESKSLLPGFAPSGA